MSGCLDRIPCDIDLGEKRNTIASITSGFLFFTGWWIIIGVAATYPSPSFNNAYYTCGVIGTISMIMINAVSNSQVRGDAMTDGLLGTRGARVWLLLGFVLGFGSLIASIWIFFAAFVVQDGKTDAGPGVCLLFQNLLVLFASLTYKFGRSEDLWA